MRAFLAACFVSMLIATGVWAILEHLVQEPVSTAFTTSAVRLDQVTPPDY
ncbi:MAG: hypothetical protein QOK23_965 [Gammaproteobacteria bacterium]|jgi:hypothetical protein|nr:hypothetical protein [Gammaproteobacteria bacterium]MEA3138796.1 hypothetical protein [Gammaproteobacteria bacterium]